MKKRYAHINFKPPKGVRLAAKRGLELRKKFGRGGLTTKQAAKLGIGSGIVRAANLARGTKMAPDTVRRMKNYFTRHQKDKRPGWAKPSNPSNGYIAWLLWGGDPGFSWARKIVRQMNAVDKK
jgi:hypothetical protein